MKALEMIEHCARDGTSFGRSYAPAGPDEETLLIAGMGPVVRGEIEGTECHHLAIWRGADRKIHLEVMNRCADVRSAALKGLTDDDAREVIRFLQSLL